MKNMRLTVCIGIMCGWLAAGMLHAGTRPDHVRPVEEDGSRLWQWQWLWWVTLFLYK